MNTSVFADLNGGAALKYVNCKLIAPDNSTVVSLDMTDNGVLPDSAAGDGRYSCSINATGISCLLVGGYTLRYVAENNEGLFSNQITAQLQAVNTANQAPVVSNANLPDSVVRPLTGQFDLTITVDVNDADGNCDILSVYFDAYRPSGTFIGRIPMTPAGNNSYSFTNPVLPSIADSSYGYFKYFFQASDRSNALSSMLKDSIKFVRP